MKYIDLFAGIGGFRYGLEKNSKQQTRRLQCLQHRGNKSNTFEEHERDNKIGFNCAYANEWDKYASQIYKKHYGEIDTTDITKVKAKDIPDHDLLCAGFPCQAFSIAGKRGGFDDTRGTIFFEIARIAKEKRPRYLLLENVKGLLSHDKGKTFQTILGVLSDLGYRVEWQVLNSKHFGVPQNRERVFIVGHRNDIDFKPVFPLKSYSERIPTKEKVFILQKDVSKDIGTFLQVLQKGKGKVLSSEQMQKMYQKVRQAISEGKCREVQENTEEVEQESQGSLQVVEELNSWSSNRNNSKGVCGLVQIPTEEVLLLWSKGGDASISFRRLQQQDLSFDSGQDRFVKELHKGQSGFMLFAVQPYQGRLFFSVGNGRDWRKIYQAEMEAICSPTLSTILEDSVDEKYFLSKDKVKRIMINTKHQKPYDTPYDITTETKKG